MEQKYGFPMKTMAQLEALEFDLLADTDKDQPQMVALLYYFSDSLYLSFSLRSNTSLDAVARQHPMLQRDAFQ